MASANTLQSLGWRQSFQSQLDTDSDWVPARVLSVHRNRVEIAHAEGREKVPLAGRSAALKIAVGDWVLVDREGPRIGRLLERFGVFKRGAAGTARTRA